VGAVSRTRRTSRATSIVGVTCATWNVLTRPWILRCLPVAMHPARTCSPRALHRSSTVPATSCVRFRVVVCRTTEACPTRSASCSEASQWRCVGISKGTWTCTTATNGSGGSTNRPGGPEAIGCGGPGLRSPRSLRSLGSLRPGPPQPPGARNPVNPCGTYVCEHLLPMSPACARRERGASGSRWTSSLAALRQRPVTCSACRYPPLPDRRLRPCRPAARPPLRT